MKNPTSLPIRSFLTEKHFEAWLAKNHATSQGVWVRFFKKASGKKTVVYAQALDVALCYGWIDSQVQRYDAESYLQKFTPRRAKSMWSKRNVQHVVRLTSEGRMRASGVHEVERAQKDGRWDSAYSSPSNMTIPDDFLKILEKHPEAQTFYKTLSRSNLYAIAWRLETAKKPETRKKRMEAIISMLLAGKYFHKNWADKS